MTNTDKNINNHEENKDLIARLMKSDDTAPEDTTDDISLSSARVVSTRYKVLLLVGAFILVLLLQYLIFPAVDKHQGLQ